MKRKQLTVLALAAMLTVGAASAGLYDSWGYKAQVQFSGYSRTETLTNFPALVVLSNNCFSGFSYSQFKSGTNDLAFTADAAGTMNLNYEIDTWNTNGSSYVWVQVPALVGNSTITVWWSGVTNSAPASQTNGTTWDSGFHGVWHLKETSGAQADSTTNQKNSTSINVTSQGAAGGSVGGADLFNASHYQVVTPALNLNTNTITISAWVNGVENADWAGIVYVRGGTTTLGIDVVANHARYTWGNDWS